MPPPFPTTDEACAHCWDESVMISPKQDSAVHKEECAYCCRTCRHTGGILVCMCCHTGLCTEHTTKHISLNPTHAMYVWIMELPPKKEVEEEETPKDVNKLGVVAPKEYETSVCCAICVKSFMETPELALDCYQGIMHATSTGAKDAIEADGGEYVRPQCPHLVCLEQLPNPFKIPPSSSEKCAFENCECRLNNWMCMTCGAVGCPRKEAGGSAHALEHYNLTNHPTVVKLGTITPSGADFYCYMCDDEVSDVYFKTHMKHFGIDILNAKKTAKTLGEMQYDYSSQFDFNRITESGESLVPVFGPGKTGMHNFGNSCYMASVLQCLFSLKPFKEAFYHNCKTEHQNICRDNPYNCRNCQTERVASGLLSGEFSIEGNERTNSITAREFKHVFAQSHPDFSTSEQQDAQEYFIYLLEQMRRYIKISINLDSNISHPVDIFKTTIEHRIQCSSCHKVRYTREADCCLSLPIPIDSIPKISNEDSKIKDEDIELNRPRCSLESCLSLMMQSSDIECRCSACGNSVNYSKTTRVATFPDVLPIFLRRAHFDMETMTVKKHDIFVDVPEEINLDFIRSKGIQDNEVQMPDTDRDLLHKPVSSQLNKIDETSLTILLSMGIEENIAKYALLQTGMNAERAIDYVFSRDNITQEMAQATGSGNLNEVQESLNLESIQDGPAQYRLHAMISHMGASAKTGHYVCHIRDEETGKWLLFNDEKVAESRNPPFSMASLYFYKRYTRY